MLEELDATRTALATAILLASALSPRDGHTQHARFISGPVTLEDQGSFFIGGVTEVSELATVPSAPPGQATPPRTPQQITVEGGCSFAQSGLTAADVDAIPYLAIKGDYTPVSAQ